MWLREDRAISIVKSYETKLEYFENAHIINIDFCTETETSIIILRLNTLSKHFADWLFISAND